MILCANPKAQYLAYRAEIDRAIHSVLERGIYIKGEEFSAFEKEFAAFIGVKFGVGVANGTDALRLALVACGVGPEDEVVTVSHTAVATVSAIEQTGATPVLADIEADYFTLDPQSLQRALTPKTKAVVAVHLYGQSVNLAEISRICKERGIRLIEDCAQSTGATAGGKRLGAFGDLSCFSFYPTKNLGALGDGGMVLTQDASLADRLKLLREYGWRERFISEISGFNSRLDELQAAVLRVKLPHLDRDNSRRIAIAKQYREGLGGLGLKFPEVRAGNDSVFHLYVLRSSRRDEFLASMRAHGVQGGIHYPQPVHLQPAYRGKIRTDGKLAATEQACQEIFSLPMYAELTSDEVAQVIRSLRAVG